MSDQLHALILTRNEAPNIERTLTKLTWISRVFVLDSYSDDETVDIAQSFDNVTVIQRDFDDHTSQWEYGRKHAGKECEWLLSLDADYQLTDTITKSIKLAVEESKACAHYARFKYAINGTVIESGIYNPVAVLFRPDSCQYRNDGHTQRLHIPERQGEDLKGFIIHDDRKSFKRWITSQVSYAQLESEKLKKTSSDELSRQDKLRKRSKLSPIIVFFYCIIIRQGYKDGTAGWIYAFQRLIAEVILQISLLEQNKD